MLSLCDLCTCESFSVAQCRCCRRSLCRDHFVEHDDSIRLQLNELTTRIDELVEQLETFDITQVAADGLSELLKWRIDSYQAIDQFYERKCSEINQYVAHVLHEQEKETEDLRLQVIKMINIQRTTDNDLKGLTSTVQILKEKMAEIEHMCIQAESYPLTIDEHLVNLRISSSLPVQSIDLSSPCQSIDRLPLSSDATASSHRYVLLHQNSSLSLVDEDQCIVGEKKWPYDWIRDMCWSSTLNSFLIVTSTDVYLVAETTLSIERLTTIRGRSWQSCACSETSLFLCRDTWNSPVEEFRLLPSIQWVKAWRRNPTSEARQRVDRIAYQNGTCALIVNDASKKEISVELRSSITFARLWTSRLDIDYSERKIQCCAFDLNKWIVADWDTSSMFVIGKDGHLNRKIEYQYKIQHVTFLRPNTLIVSTNRTFNFHKL